MSLINDTSILSQLETFISSLNVSTEASEPLLVTLKTAQNARAPSTSIITELLSRIDTITTSDTINELVLLVKAAQLIEPDRMLSVPAIADLTAFTDAIVGTVLFVQEENAPYIRKSDSSWVLIDPALQPNPLENAWSFGAGSLGVLGNSAATARSSPVSVVGGFTDWIQVSGGYRYSLGVRGNGTIWAWGYASGGKLGDGTTSNKSSPALVVGSITDWIQASASPSSGNQGHSLGLRANGTLYAWGNNNVGQLGTNGPTTGGGTSSPVLVAGGLTDWVQASAGNLFSLGIRATGQLYAWGEGGTSGLGNGAGRLGDNSTLDKSSPVLVAGGFTDWIQASAGMYGGLGIRATGQLYSWGSGTNGGLGSSTVGVSRSSPALVAGGLTDWVQASAGKNLNNHNFALRANGTLYGWGANSSGVLGNNTTANSSSPVLVTGGITSWVQVETAAAHTLAVSANGILYAWGSNGNGTLGNNLTANTSSPVTVVGGFNDWLQASAGNTPHSLGIRGRNDSTN